MKEASLYNGTIQLTRDDDHKYWIGGVQKVGTTTITGILDKPLIKWAVDTGSAEAKRILFEMFKTGEPVDPASIDKITSAIVKAPFIKRDTAANIGTDVHLWIEQHIRAQIGFDDEPMLPKSEPVVKGVRAFLDWEATNHVRYINTERLTYSKITDTCGTEDTEAVLNATPVVIDFKTGKAFIRKGRYFPYKEYRLQTASYTCSRNEEETGNPLQGIEHRVILNLSRETGEFSQSAIYGPEELKKDWDAFQFLRRVYDWRESIE